MSSTKVWRITAYGTYAASSSATVRSFTLGCFWGATALTAINAGVVLASVAQTSNWTVELEISGSSATAAWCTGMFNGNVTTALATAIPQNVIATAASVTALTTTSTLDFRVGQTGTATAGDIINVHSVILERIK